jgi:hypothetical protein
MPDIYDKFDAAFRKVAAYALIHDGKAIGRAAIKYPADGAGRLTFYLQLWGARMVYGTASGGGYDKATAAFQDAAAKMRPDPEYGDSRPELASLRDTVKALAADPGGVRWSDRLERAGIVAAVVIG